jgi:hypothetical protein
MTQLVTDTIELLKTSIYSTDIKESREADCQIFMNIKKMSNEEMHDYRFEARKIEDPNGLFNDIVNSQYDF